MYRNIGIQGNSVTSFECSISLFCDNFCIFLGCCDINIQTKEVQQQKNDFTIWNEDFDM